MFYAAGAGLGQAFLPTILSFLSSCIFLSPSLKCSLGSRYVPYNHLDVVGSQT